jgi:hypothetical protein
MHLVLHQAYSYFRQGSTFGFDFGRWIHVYLRSTANATEMAVDMN